MSMDLNPKIYSFYSENISTSFRFMESGNLEGIIVMGEHTKILREFVGLYERTDKHINLAFGIEVDGIQPGKSTIMFFGEINSALMESLDLKWLKTTPNGSEQSTAKLSGQVHGEIKNIGKPISQLLELYAN